MSLVGSSILLRRLFSAKVMSTSSAGSNSTGGTLMAALKSSALANGPNLSVYFPSPLARKGCLLLGHPPSTLRHLVFQHWFLSDRYLPYALGGGYVLGMDAVKYIARNADIFSHYVSEVCDAAIKKVQPCLNAGLDFTPVFLRLAFAYSSGRVCRRVDSAAAAHPPTRYPLRHRMEGPC